ncbi:hypothetical protein [Marinicella meishanensis]|uniref:hypothetical protein n=1 Tax=Marinicella meishanensis TaxID=2873263 RepID=UPI001CBF074F|nr:hypothetical protein [Marinicella sp. NBU2979]
MSGFMRVILPMLAVALSPVLQATEEPVACGQNAAAQALAEAIMAHPDQARPELVCNEQLAAIAQQRAESLAKNAHDPDITPNQIVVDGGFRFPSYYPVSGNQVEAVARDTREANAALTYLTESGKHHDQILGKVEFFALQSQLGVGFYADDDPTNHPQWVVLTAEPWLPPKVVFKTEMKAPKPMKQDCDTDWQRSDNEFLKRKCSRLKQSKRKRD